MSGCSLTSSSGDSSDDHSQLGITGSTTSTAAQPIDIGIAVGQVREVRAVQPTDSIDVEAASVSKNARMGL